MQCSRFISAFLLGVFTLSLQAPAFAASSREPEVPRGATAFFDYVFHEDTEGDFEDYSGVLNDNDTLDEAIMFEEGDQDQAFYMGTENAPFTKVFFQMESGLDLEGDDEEDDLLWQYYNGSMWRTLDVDYGAYGGLDSLAGRSASFDFPSDWEKTEVNDYEGYFVRLTLEADVESDAVIEKLSAMAYTIQVTLKSNNGDKITGLNRSDFAVNECRDDNVYAVEEVSRGTYWVAVQTAFRNQTCKLSVQATKYYDRSIEVEPSTDAPMVTRVLSYSPEWSKAIREERARCQTPFVDIDTHWSADAVREVYCSGVIDGSRFFMPNREMTRAEFIHILMVTAEVDFTRQNEAYFQDVHHGDVYFEAVQTAYELDVIDRDRYFRPQDSLTRAEAVTMTMRLANRVESIRTSDTNTRFWDVRASDWFAGTVKAATNYQIVVGYVDGSFRGNNKISRAEGVVVSNNYWYAFVRDAKDNRHQ